ncbi:uncharacterized protein LAJ45_07910 [Morchella importuna]|uniref:uncharacterized protein n=1 Tax=Morchella importuna TaxID=1174673 RepID=UPI001E8DBBEC|nr:uncharacterized protein LAJ45_07910 [Morchella importuna]KAH8148146.1 hypothetical protein LAJ45_07910 [Morchella importuna]
MVSKYKPTRDRKQRHRKPKPNAPSDATDAAVQDPNASILIPESKSAKELRRAELRAELQSQQQQPKMSSKKAKRLAKYIENKLRKEERVELIQKLADQPHKVDTSLLRSTKTMGTARESKRETMRRALLEEKFGINMEENKKILYEERTIRDADELEVEAPEVLAEVPEAPVEEKEEVPEPVVIKVGSGLKRPLEIDETGLPIIKKIRKSKEAKKERLMAMIKAIELEEEQKARAAAEGASSDEGEDSDEEMDSDNDGSGADDSEGEESEEEWGGIQDTPSEGSVAAETEPDAEVDSDASSEEDEEGSESDSDSESGSGSGSSGEEESDSSGEAESVPRMRRGQSDKANAFKSWALAQVKAVAQENDPTGADTSMPDLLNMPPSAVHVHIPRPREQDMTPPPELQGPTVERKAYYIAVDRSPEIQQTRFGLPVVAEEQRIMEAIHNNSCVVICGETGSGKTTQVPQFLYEAGYGSPGSETPGLIGVTQPRRVAAVSMASRVGTELGTGGKDKVAYQIRFEGTVGKDTAIKFMTDGVLLRELADDFLLRKYSAVVIDEAHERSVNTDILIGVMSRVLKLREEMSKKDKVTKPLKLIIMSATLRVSDFIENKQLFSVPPPLLKAEARQHPVTNHFSRRTPHDYVEEACKKICKIHRRLPPGGILVFMTGQNEITTLLKRLKTTFPFKASEGAPKSKENAAPEVRISARDAAVEAEDVEFGARPTQEAGSDDDDDGDSILDEDDDDLGEEMAETDTEAPLHVLPLYSLLPTKDQMKVFEPAPEGRRMCVLATNVAETSLTIPGIRALISAGLLYSSAVYERDFDEFAEPEILRMPIEGIVLQMKSMNIDTITNFPFPTPPDRPSLQKAERLLGYLGALDSKGGLTELGRTMNVFPLSPRFSKILIIGQQHGCLPYIIAIVAALTVGEVFIPEHQLDIADPPSDDDAPPAVETAHERNQRATRRKAYNRAHRAFSALDPTSDALKLLSVVCAYEYEPSPAAFCERNFVRLKAMQETRKLRQQLTNIVRTNCPPGILAPFSPQIPPPSQLQVKAIKQIIAAGFIDQVAIRADLLPNSTYKLGQASLKRVSDVPYMTLFASSTAHGSDNMAEVAAYVHPGSALAQQESYPEYVVYSELKRGVAKVRLRPLTPVTGTQLAALAKGTPLLSYSKPLESVAPKVVEGSGGNSREVWVIPRMGGAVGRSELGWPLPARKVVQQKVAGKWVVE